MDPAQGSVIPIILIIQISGGATVSWLSPARFGLLTARQAFGLSLRQRVGGMPVWEAFISHNFSCRLSCSVNGYSWT